MADFASSEAGKLGGDARKKSLTQEQRREIAERAAVARWGDTLPKATHGSEDRPLTIGNTEIACYVLEDGTRVLTQADFLEALGKHRKANVKNVKGMNDEERVPEIIKGQSLKPFISPELLERQFGERHGPHVRGGEDHGYRAEILPEVCEVYLKARDEGALQKQQKHIAVAAEMLMRGLAHVGIIALVDEATGYQYDRPRRELEDQLKRFLSDSLRRWVRTFPADYFKHLCRLRGVELRADMKLPQYFGKLTNNLVYRRIAPGLLKKLKARRVEMGRPKEKLHSGLSLDVGVPEVLLHLGTVVGLMKLHTNYEKFEKQLDEIAPIYPETPGLFDDPKDWEPR